MVASRAAWIIANGPIPIGYYVLHKCDNPPCVNPFHLILGTPTDNILDCISKGRGNRTGRARKVYPKTCHEYLSEADGNISAAARNMGVDRSNFRRMCKQGR
jgi:hypothetical protein